MAFTPITDEEIAAGKPVTNALLTKIQVDLNDLNGRAEGAETTTVTGNNTITARESTLTQFGDTSGGSFTTTLPSATDMLHKVLVFKKITNDGYTWTIDGAGSETIEGQLSQSLTTQNQTIYIQSDGTEWWKIADIDASGQVAQSRTINTTYPLQGGGNFTTDRTFSIELYDGYVFVGNASNAPVARQISGDLTISNTGVAAIAAGSIVDADINASAAISLSKIAPIDIGDLTTFNASIVPTVNDTYDIGSDTYEYNEIFVRQIKHGDTTNPVLAISTTSDNGNITITPHGTGKTVVTSLQIPAGASAGYLLQSDGSGNATWASVSGTTLAGLSDTTITAPAQYEVLQYNGSVWVNATVGTNNLASQAVTAAKIANLTVTASQIADATITLAKMATTTANRLLVTSSGGAPSVHGALTGSRALVSNSSGLPAVASTTSTEIGYLSGVTSNVQTQLDGKATMTTTTGTHTTGAEPSGATNQNITGLTYGGTTLQEFYIDILVLANSLYSRVTRWYSITLDKDGNSVLTLQATIGASSGSPANAAGYTLDISGGQVRYSHAAMTNHTSATFRWRKTNLIS